MTIEEIICTTKEALRVSTDYDPYAEGYQDALIWFSDMLDQLEPSWHKFPEEKPTENGYYQVTFDDGTVDLARWKDGSWTFNPKIIAWKEKDKPYKKDGTT